MNARSEWLQERRKTLGGSDVGQIPAIVEACGGDPSKDRSPWAGAGEWRVWTRKTFDKVERVPMTEQMKVGVWLEGPLLDWAFEQLEGLEMAQRDPGMRRHPTASLQGTPDAIARVAGETVGIEAKVSFDLKPWDEVPFYYQLQVRTYMAIWDLPFWDVAVFFAPCAVRRMYRVERDLDVESRLLAAVNAWWDLRIVEGEPPEVDDSMECTAGLRAMFPTIGESHFGDLPVATEHQIALARRAKHTDDAAKDLSREARRLKNLVRESAGAPCGFRWTGGSVKVSTNRVNIKTQEVQP